MLLAHKIEKAVHSCPAIYLITNTINGKIYVGQTVNFYQRYYDHKKSVNKANKTAIAFAFIKYGFENFKFTVLETGFSADKDTLNSKEQFWLDELKPYRPIGYNVCREASTMLGFRHSEATKNGFRDRMTGHKHSEETKRKMRDAHIGDKAYWYGKTQSAEHVEKLRKTRIGRPAPNRRKIRQINNGSVVAEFCSIKAAAELTGISASCIAQAANPKNRVNSAGGYTWRRA